jgi:heme/copper-type cytochrome/quinol oxidase subunit 3
MSAAIEIPYNTTERPDTGLYNAKLGVWLFLASEVMLFGALFSTYVLLRTGADKWEHGAEFLNVPLATLNTMVLIISSVTMVMSWAALKKNDFGKYRMYMGFTILCGVGFLVIKSFEYAHKFETGLFPSTSTFMALYFTMTGLHGLHVIGGMIVNSYLWGPGSKMWKTDPERFTNRIEVAGLYWHFVDLVWIFLFPTLYLLPGK